MAVVTRVGGRAQRIFNPAPPRAVFRDQVRERVAAYDPAFADAAGLRVQRGAVCLEHDVVHPVVLKDCVGIVGLRWPVPEQRTTDKGHSGMYV